MWQSFVSDNICLFNTEILTSFRFPQYEEITIHDISISSRLNIHYVITLQKFFYDPNMCCKFVKYKTNKYNSSLFLHFPGLSCTQTVQSHWRGEFSCLEASPLCSINSPLSLSQETSHTFLASTISQDVLNKKNGIISVFLVLNIHLFIFVLFTWFVEYDYLSPWPCCADFT